MRAYVWPVLLAALFLAYSLPLFLRVLTTTQMVIDEEFHLRQGLHFCNGRFDIWDRKITTFPGLYIISVLMNPLGLCTIVGMRLVSLVAATINVILFYKIRRRKMHSSSTMVALDAFTLAALPPLYFFSHLYYTDTLSLTMVLLLYYYWDKKMHLRAAIFGAASVLMRQTNVVWVAMLFGIEVLDDLKINYAHYRHIKSNDVSFFKWKTWLDILRLHRLIKNTIISVFLNYSYYMVVILPFIGFVYLNGSIVIGDKDAHAAIIHLPQMLYFGVFFAIFQLTITITRLNCVYHLLRQHIVAAVLIACALAIIVQGNTIVHPYLLADNRHYTFYIWNRFYGRYSWFKFAMIPIYMVALTLLHLALAHMHDTFKIMFWLAVAISLCFQRLLEIRYFLVPFVLYRLIAKPLERKRSHLFMWLELGYYVVINAATFYVFFTKEIIWSDFKDIQRIIW